MIALLALALACAADAISTLRFLRAGTAHEALSAWIIGKHPKPWAVWAWVFVAPVAASAAVLHLWPTAWWAIGLAAVARGVTAWRNFRF